MRPAGHSWLRFCYVFIADPAQVMYAREVEAGATVITQVRSVVCDINAPSWQSWLRSAYVPVDGMLHSYGCG
jgi:hypothetical protein